MIEKIEAIICAGEGFLPVQIHVNSRIGEIKQTRQIIMYFAKKETNMTLAAIGRFFSRDHATVLSAVNVIGNYIDTDSVFREKIRQYQAKINELKESFKKIDAVTLLFDSLQKKADDLNQEIIELQAVLLNIKNDVANISKI